MSELLSCPYCGGEMQVAMYDEEFYQAVLGTDYECDPEYIVEHVDRLAAAKAKCPFEMVCYKSEADAIAAWNRRADDDADLIPEVVRRLEEFERTGGETVSLEEIMAEDGWVRERSCHNVSDDPCWYECSSCKCTCSIDYLGDGIGLPNYCPFCGAKVVSE